MTVLWVIEQLRTMPWLLLLVAAWALWVATLLSWWTYAGAVAAGVAAGSLWGTPTGVDIAAGALLVGYVIDCMIDPRADCWFCRGSAKRRNDRSYFHLCWVCNGSGQRKRWGSKALRRHRASATDIT